MDRDIDRPGLITTPGLNMPQYPKLHGAPLAGAHGDYASIEPFYGIRLDQRLPFGQIQAPNSNMKGMQLADMIILSETGHKVINVNYYPQVVGPEESEIPQIFWDAFNPQYNSVKGLLERNPDTLMAITDSATLTECLTGNKMGMYFSVEGIYGEDAENLEVLAKLRALGVFFAMYTHNVSNAFAGSVSDPEKGLTDLGKEAAPYANSIGIVNDSAHAGPQTKADLLKYSTRVVDSHSGFYDIVPNRRNLSLEYAQEITRRGGFVGLAIEVASFMVAQGEERGVKSIQKQVEYGEKHGIRMVIGDDKGGVAPGSYQKWGNVAESTPAIVKGLIEMGLPFERIRALMGGALIDYLGNHFASIEAN